MMKRAKTAGLPAPFEPMLEIFLAKFGLDPDAQGHTLRAFLCEFRKQLEPTLILSRPMKIGPTGELALRFFEGVPSARVQDIKRRRETRPVLAARTFHKKRPRRAVECVEQRHQHCARRDVLGTQRYVVMLDLQLRTGAFLVAPPAPSRIGPTQIDHGPDAAVAEKRP